MCRAWLCRYLLLSIVLSLHEAAPSASVDMRLFLQTVTSTAEDIVNDDSKSLQLVSERRLRGTSDSPLLLFGLRDVHMQAARDNRTAYVSAFVSAIATALKVDVMKIKPVSLVYSSHEYGSLIFIFVVNNELCGSHACSQAWLDVVSDKSFQIDAIFGKQADRNFPHQVNAALCKHWNLRGRGCGITAPSKLHEVDGRTPLSTLLLYSVLPGFAVSMIIFCAAFRLSQICKASNEVKHLPSTPKLHHLRCDRVSLKDIDENATCPICLCSPVEAEGDDLLIPPCKHFMHVSCAKAWLAKQLQCPLCRGSIKTHECLVWQLLKDGISAESCSPSHRLREICCKGDNFPVASKLCFDVLPPGEIAENDECSPNVVPENMMDAIRTGIVPL